MYYDALTNALRMDLTIRVIGKGFEGCPEDYDYVPQYLNLDVLGRIYRIGKFSDNRFYVVMSGKTEDEPAFDDQIYTVFVELA
jgi:hypothetical protein